MKQVPTIAKNGPSPSEDYAVNMRREADIFDAVVKPDEGAIVGTLANGYIKSVPLPRVTTRAAHVTTVKARRQALTPVPYGLAPVPLSSPMTKHQFSHESESFVQPLIIMRRDTSLTTSYYLPRLQHTVLINQLEHLYQL